VRGEFRRARAEVKPRRPARSEQSSAKKFSFPLEEKEIVRQIKIRKENFFAEQRAKRAAAGRSGQSSESGFSSKKVRISSNKHHHIELAASLGASPLASAGRFARKLKGFLKSIESFCWLIWRFANLESLLVLKNKSRFFSLAKSERQSEILLNCRCEALPFSNIIKE
jgi:hypothetical protein